MEVCHGQQHMRYQYRYGQQHMKSFFFFYHILGGVGTLGLDVKYNLLLKSSLSELGCHRRRLC